MKFAVHIINAQSIRNINETPIKITISIVNDFEIPNKKFEIRPSVIGSKIDAVNFRKRLKITMFKIGTKTVENTIKSPESPIAFFIRTLLAIIILKPSARYPPKIGM